MQLGLKQELAADMICVRKNLEELMAAPPESDALLMKLMEMNARLTCQRTHWHC